MNVLNRTIQSIHHVRPFIRLHNPKSYSSAANQISRAMKKLSVIGGSKKKKKAWHDSFLPMPGVPSENIKQKLETSKQGKRRLSMLNKLFMTYITDMMATGEISQELLGKGIQITGIKVTSDFGMVNVMWVGNGTVSDEEIEKCLKEAGAKLKHELSKLRVMGVVPYINFVYDKKLGKINEVEELLKIADYPDDYTPTEVAERLKDEFELYGSLSPDLVKKIKALDAEQTEEIDEKPLPEMQHNVFGLDQDGIMRKISSEKEQIRAAWEQYETKSGVSSQIEVKTDTKSIEETKERFKKFLESKEFYKKDRKRSKIQVYDPYEGRMVEEVNENDFYVEDTLAEDEREGTSLEKQ